MLEFWLFGGVAQLGERRVRNAEVGSSILLLSTNIQRLTGPGRAFSFPGSATPLGVPGGLDDQGIRPARASVAPRRMKACFETG